MARRRGGFGGVLMLLAGVWLISLFAGGKEHTDPVKTTPPYATTRSDDGEENVDRTNSSERIETRPTPSQPVDIVATP